MDLNPVRVDAVGNHYHSAEQISAKWWYHVHIGTRNAYGGAVKTYVTFRLSRKLLWVSSLQQGASIPEPERRNHTGEEARHSRSDIRLKQSACYEGADSHLRRRTIYNVPMSRYVMGSVAAILNACRAVSSFLSSRCP